MLSPAQLSYSVPVLSHRRVSFVVLRSVMTTIVSQDPTLLHPYAAPRAGLSAAGLSKTGASSSTGASASIGHPRLGTRDVSAAQGQVQRPSVTGMNSPAQAQPEAPRTDVPQGQERPSEQMPAAAPPVATEPPREHRRIRFDVGSKYRVQEIIGEGAYGVVCAALHRPSGQRVAIKKIAPFDHSSKASPVRARSKIPSSPAADPSAPPTVFALRTLRELKLLRFFAENQVSENLITVVDIVKPASYDLFQEVSEGPLSSIAATGRGADLIWGSVFVTRFISFRS